VFDESGNEKIEFLVFFEIREVNLMKVAFLDVFGEREFFVVVVGVFQQWVDFFIVAFELVVGCEGDLLAALELIGDELLVADVELVFFELGLDGVDNLLVQRTQLVEFHLLPGQGLNFLTQLEVWFFGGLCCFGLGLGGQWLKIYFWGI
jgi:hypothetical protein